MTITRTAAALGFATLLLAACAGSSGGSGGNGGGGSGGGSGSSSGSSTAACVDVNGTWSGSDQVDASACGQGSYSDSGSLVLTQAADSCSVTVSYYGYGSMSGTVNGSSLSFSGSYQKFNGTVTIDTVDVTVSSDQTTMSGTVTWTYTGASRTCNGSTTISGTKTGT